MTKVAQMDAVGGTPDPVAETAWLRGLPDATGWPNAIVAACDLAAPDAAEQLARQAASLKLRGVRDLRPTAILAEPAFRRGYPQLARRGLVFSHTVGWPAWALARDLVRSQPDVVF